MWVTTTISLVAIMLAYLSQRKARDRYFEWGFVFLTIIAAIQYGYGSDYMRYYDLWDIESASKDVKYLIANFFEQTGWTEPGWKLLNALCGFKNGFFLLVAIISIVENYIYYRLIKDYVSPKWRWLAVFLYVGMDNLYLLNFSMFRQGLTVALFVASIMLLNKRKIVPAIAIIVLSLTIHLSSAICIPFIILYFMPLRNTKVLAITILIFTFVIFVFKDLVIEGMKFAFAFEELSKYSGYSRKTLGGIGLGYLLHHIPNFVFIYTLLADRLINNREKKVLVILAFCDMLITPLQFYGAGLAGRLGIYFMAFRVAAIPMVYSAIKDEGVRWLFVFLTIVSTLIMYYQFFQMYIEGYSEGYRTIFSVL